MGKRICSPVCANGPSAANSLSRPHNLHRGNLLPPVHYVVCNTNSAHKRAFVAGEADFHVGLCECVLGVRLFVMIFVIEFITVITIINAISMTFLGARGSVVVKAPDYMEGPEFET
jgi:hypothetical protein